MIIHACHVHQYARISLGFIRGNQQISRTEAQLTQKKKSDMSYYAVEGGNDS